MYRHLRSEFSGRIATVTLERPDRRNALSAELMREPTACALDSPPIRVAIQVSRRCAGTWDRRSVAPTPIIEPWKQLLLWLLAKAF